MGCSQTRVPAGYLENLNLQASLKVKALVSPFSLSLSLPLRPEGLDSARQRKRCPLALEFFWGPTKSGNPVGILCDI